MTIEEVLVALIFAINLIAHIYAYYDSKKEVKIRNNHFYNGYPFKRMIIVSFVGLLVVLFY